MVREGAAADRGHVMPVRGAVKAWRIAVEHARTLPTDGVSLWVCRGGHRYVVVGVFVDYKGMHLVCTNEYGHRTGQSWCAGAVSARCSGSRRTGTGCGQLGRCS